MQKRCILRCAILDWVWACFVIFRCARAFDTVGALWVYIWDIHAQLVSRSFCLDCRGLWLYTMLGNIGHRIIRVKSHIHRPERGKLLEYLFIVPWRDDVYIYIFKTARVCLAQRANLITVRGSLIARALRWIHTKTARCVIWVLNFPPCRHASHSINQCLIKMEQKSTPSGGSTKERL